MKPIDRVLCVTPAVFGLGALVAAVLNERHERPVALAVGITALIVGGFAVMPLALRR